MDIISILVFLIIIAALIFIHELGHFLLARATKTRVDEFAIGFPPRLVSRISKKSGTRYSLNAIPFGGYVAIFGENPDEASMDPQAREESFYFKPWYAKVAILLAGVAGNVLLAWVIYTGLFMTGFPVALDGLSVEDQAYVAESKLMVSSVAPDSPAEAAGLIGGEVITEISDTTRTLSNPTPEALSDFTKSSQGKEITLTYTRGKEVLEESISLSNELTSNRQAIGITTDTFGRAYFPFLRAYGLAFRHTINSTQDVVWGLGTLIHSLVWERDGSAAQAVSGPIGIVSLVGEYASIGWQYVLSLTAILSLNLAVINLVPFPALDGGRILQTILEAVARRPLPASFANRLNAVGFALLILLMVVITFSDIAKLFS